MPLPQDIRPVFQDIQDTLVRSEAPWIQQTPLSSVKVLWVGRETGTWASLHHWKKDYVAPAQTPRRRSCLYHLGQAASQKRCPERR